MKFNRIKGTDKPQNIIRLPRLGKIRLGIKKISKTSGKEYPAEVDYFVVPEEVKRVVGDQPKLLSVMLPVEDEDMFLRQYYACYGGNQKIKCQGDGEKAERRNESGGKDILDCPSPEFCDYAKQYKCHARLDLMVVLPDVNLGGVYQLSTGSINSDIDIRSGIEMAKHLFGRICYVPMNLVREERKIPDPNTGNMTTHWPVKLYPVATIAETVFLRGDTKRILDRQARIALPEPVIEGAQADTPVEIVDEDVQVVTPQEQVDLTNVYTQTAKTDTSALMDAVQPITEAAIEEGEHDMTKAVRDVILGKEYGNTVRGLVNKITKKAGTGSNGKSYVKYHIQIADIDLTTFSDTVSKDAQEAKDKGLQVEVEYEVKGNYKNIKSLKLIKEDIRDWQKEFEEAPDSSYLDELWKEFEAINPNGAMIVKMRRISDRKKSEWKEGK